ncbi:MAG: hypothetical protein ACYDHD_06495 [Vulcanimicrobiaceae bacterium]
MKLLLVAFVLALLVWLAPRNSFWDFMGILAYWLTVVGVGLIMVRRAP